MSTVYLIPSLLAEDGIGAIPPYILEAVKDCQIFFVENERTARRYLKKVWKEMVIDNYHWVAIHKTERASVQQLVQSIEKGMNVGIISEAGCPGIADPGQALVAAAHQHGATVRPLVGPNAMLLALMASGLDGQRFSFAGYLPIDHLERRKAIQQLETESGKKNQTQVFIETPYRNGQLLDTILATCQKTTRVCIAADITAATEWIQTKTVGEWKQQLPDLHKRPVIFCLLSKNNRETDQ